MNRAHYAIGILLAVTSWTTRQALAEDTLTAEGFAARCADAGGKPRAGRKRLGRGRKRGAWAMPSGTRTLSPGNSAGALFVNRAFLRQRRAQRGRAPLRAQPDFPK